jgi:hypothetical protein
MVSIIMASSASDHFELLLPGCLSFISFLFSFSVLFFAFFFGLGHCGVAEVGRADKMHVQCILSESGVGHVDGHRHFVITRVHYTVHMMYKANVIRSCVPSCPDVSANSHPTWLGQSTPCNQLPAFAPHYQQPDLPTLQPCYLLGLFPH